MGKFEWRQPFGLVANRDDIPEDKQYKLHYSIGATLFTPPISEADYVFKRSQTTLLIDIDDNNVSGVEKALKQDNINVNTLYVIPDWEVPEAGRPMFETFLHRALWARSADVFGFLLQNGASPRIKGHCHKTVIENLFDGQVPEKEIVRYGEMLIDAGVKTTEIKRASKDRNKNAYVKTLISYAKRKKAKSFIKKSFAVFSKNAAHTRV